MCNTKVEAPPEGCWCNKCGWVGTMKQTLACSPNEDLSSLIYSRDKKHQNICPQCKKYQVLPI